MTKKAVLPMESYRLAQYAVQVPCYICENGNTFDAEICRHCQAPMALAHQANQQKVRPRMVAVIGSSGAGKTVYLGMLMDMLSRPNDQLHVLARGAFSITLQQMTVGALSRGEFPEKTPGEPDRWNWVHCQVRARSQRRPAELIMPDMAGEAILEEIDHPRTYPIIRSMLAKASGVMILVDASALQEGEQEQDFYTMKMLSYLTELEDSPKKTASEWPVAMIFTKADQCDLCFDDPTDYAKTQTPGLWQHCQERFRRHRFFAAGVAGACAFRPELGEGLVRVPLRIEPHGIVEPFQWLAEQIKS